MTQIEMSKRETRKQHQQTPRDNETLAHLHANSAALLDRIAKSGGQVSQRDCAMAGIYAGQLERRRRRNAVASGVPAKTSTQQQ